MLERALANGRSEIDKICLRNRANVERAPANGRPEIDQIWPHYRRLLERVLANRPLLERALASGRP